MAASTLAEVAKLAGVSPATASRVLNGSARTPGAGIAERVRQAAESLGYVANAQAQALAKSSTGLIGLIVHDIADPYFSAIARGVQSAARQERRMVLLATTDGTPAGEKEAAAAFAARRADAIVIAGSRSTRAEDSAANGELAAELERYCRNGGRLGVVGQGIIGLPETEGYRTLPVPNEELARGLAAELAAAHTGPFVIVAGPDGLATSDERVRGFQRGLAEAGREPAEVLHTAFSRNGGFDAGTQLAGRPGDRGGRPCIFAGNDVMAIGIVAALRERGLSVPGEAAVAGFDDIEWLRDFRPELSTVGLPLEEIGRRVTLGALSDLPAEDDAASGITGTVRLRRSTETA
ncbi:LacI family DNA-binding transcriptional regulator [Arthrobacter cupressi]|uniref:LacI family DNA-binding transcriptional regulator n=1 Tax=Arthrobacter cupressi TaxID=1045773 RepID=UPI0009427041|nr:LacI family DNA-binding transcriptional regulator [Arthrobacter cupressi]NYD77684.1 LacI family transcriptional regulator [Arthrobacter cupressi]